MSVRRAPSARPSPDHGPSALWTPSRRALLAGAAAAAAGPLLAACGSSSGGSGGGGSSSKTVTLGSNGSDAVPKKAYAALWAAAGKSTGDTLKVNVKQHENFQNQINSYLQGTPDDVFTWFAGYRMQFFAKQGLASPIDDVWQTIGSHFTPAIQALSKGLDGKYYFVPLYYYPWAIWYRKSVFKQHGYTIPANWDQFTALLKKMKGDGLVPLAFGNQNQWPVMGTFDQINFRLNGYQFHVDLMHGKESWTDARVKKTFDMWASIMPYHQQGAAGRKTEDATGFVRDKKAGMIVAGAGTAVQQFTTDPAALADLDFFPFPEITPQWGMDTVEAPCDGFMMSKSPKNKTGATKVLEFFGSPAGEKAYLDLDSSELAAAKDFDNAKNTALQKKEAALITGAKNLTQFMDRDGNPTFVSTVMIPALADFVRSPNTFAATKLSNIEAQKKSIYASS
ncbi:sugar ABC transporter substrate-binding protein [Mangrovactinospora gilvigrisea]|uniref:Sugar ABC transporter substrate-binding protein n=1 Tax=Mangrovactinospora gilvigrisea TaxID=1428644 RepID=A0A1J7CBA6_9ACTN|nr:ABC transporter substrate-binding protein [Mangrovactinospora gilvigrisea]OIV38788.1 sugar ABC transporter substrate-binding protein [Mangrovactinospora gilvigrisea]